MTSNQDISYPRDPKAQQKFLEDRDLLNRIQGLQRFLLASCLSISNYSGGAPIFKEGQLGSCLYIIQQGDVLIYKAQDRADGKDENSKQSHLTILGPGKVFGEMACLDKSKPTRSASAQAIGQTTVFCLDVQSFDIIQAEFPSLALDLLLFDLTDRIRENNNHIEILASMHRAQRVARFLLGMAIQRGEDDNGAIRFDLGMPQTIVAKLLNITDAFLTMQLGVLQDSGIIRRDRATPSSRAKSGERSKKPQRIFIVMKMDELKEKAKASH